MPITFDPTEVSADSVLSGHVVCFPAISQKDVSAHDPEYLKNIYTALTGANYYTQHASSTSARGKTGTFTIHTKGDGGVINMFVCLYPGMKTLANDNLSLRLKYFKSCLENLISCRTLTTLHFTFPIKDGPDSDLKEYLLILEDFWATYKLNNSTDLKIIVHHQELNSGPRTVIKKKMAPNTPATADTPKSAPVEVSDTFILDCTPENINEQTLYEVDFVRYTLKESASPMETAPVNDTIMKYFPNSSKWNFVINDQRLANLADEIPVDTVVKDTVYPPPEDLFNAFSYMKEDLKIVLLGQDPYHRKGQAHGLSFSVQRGVAIPPSLRNIYKALANDIPGFTAPKHGCLTEWAEQGILMLNTALTVDEGAPGSHLNIWEPFTDRLITLLSEQCKGLVFILWGNKAKAKARLIAKSGGHLILECQHPSPQITNNTFDKDCKHFSMANAWLKDHGKTPINWQL
jgi:uracil-DNA glycosylase